MVSNYDVVGQTTNHRFAELVTKDIYSPKEIAIKGTVGEELKMGDFLICDTADMKFRKMLLSDVPDLPITEPVPVIAIVKRDFTLGAAEGTYGMCMLMGEFAIKESRVDDFSTKAETFEYMLFKNNLYAL